MLRRIESKPCLAAENCKKCTELTIYSYLVGCCPISDLFGKGEPILGGGGGAKRKRERVELKRIGEFGTAALYGPNDKLSGVGGPYKPR